MRIFDHSFKTARPVLWKIERHFGLNLLNHPDHLTARDIYDLWVIVSKEFYAKWGREMSHDDKVDWKVFTDRIKYLARNN